MNLNEEEDIWKCRKHPSRPRPRLGICPSCLRDRLLLLCPDCRELRPCICFRTSSSTSSTTSSFSISSFDPPRSSVSGGIETVGRVSNLIESEPAFRRSRSVAFGFRRPRFDLSVFGILTRKKEESEKRLVFSRSRSVGVPECKSDSGAKIEKIKGWKWLPSPMRAFRKAASKLNLEQSPLRRG